MSGTRDSTEKTAVQLFGGGARPQSTRDRLVHAALNLYYEHGIHAVGIDRIVAEVGVTKTTFYNHFECKDDLTIAAIRLRDQWEHDTFSRQVAEQAGPDPGAQLLAMFDVLDAWFNNPEYKGCLFLAACQEYPSFTDPIHIAARQHYAAGRDGIEQLAQASGVAAPAALADEWILLIQGAISMRQVAGDNDAARKARVIAVQRLTIHTQA
jgi:AcrR family transcriptional regulator